MEGQTPEPNSPSFEPPPDSDRAMATWTLEGGRWTPGSRWSSEECDCDEDNPDRRIHWQIFIATLVGMALLAAVVLGLLQLVRNSHREDEISRRARYQACQSLENEITRANCIEGRR